MSTYSTNLKIEEIGTGEQAGTWGTTTNDNFVNVFEEAIVGRVTVSFSNADVTLTATNSVASQSFRNVYLNCTGTNAASRNLIVPTINKNYVVQNNTTGGFDIVVKTTAGTGITVPNGRTCTVYADGTNVIQAFDYLPTLNVPTLNITTLDATNIEVTNIKAKDGTASATIADSTGIFTHSTATVFTAGTVAAPAITTTGDTNTGIFFPAADTIAFSEGGVESMRITSAGDVGIGTTSPAAKLDIRGNIYQLGAGSAIFQQADGTNNAFWQLNPLSISNSFGAVSNNAIPFIIGNNNLERMRITSAGNVGIGNSSPASLLDVGNTSSGFTAISVRSTTTGISELRFADTSDNPGFIAYDHTTNLMRFGTVASNQMFIDSSGNIGIGTSSPATRLDVRFTTNPVTDNGTGVNALRVWTNVPQAADVGGAISFGGYYNAVPDSAAFGQIAGRKENSTANNLSGYLQFSLNGSAGTMTERMRITSAGFVGIGTDTPADKLHINNGNQRITNGAAANADIEIAGNANTIGTTSFLLRQSNTSQALVYNRANADMIFGTNSAERMRITSGGNVGIGTSSPSHILDVVGSTSRFSGSTIAGANLLLNNTQGTSFKSQVTWQANGAAKFSIGVDSAGVGSNNFYIYDDAVGTIRMIIGSSGLVGINTATPNANGALTVSQSTTGTSTDGIRLVQTNTGQSGIYLQRTGGTASDWLMYQPQGSTELRFFGGSTDRVVINTNGNFGINTSATAALSVYTGQNALATLIFGSNNGRMLGKFSANGGSVGKTINLLTISSFSSPNTRVFINVKVMWVNPILDEGNTATAWAGASQAGTRTQGSFVVSESWGTSTVGSLSWSGSTLRYTTPAAPFASCSIDVEFAAFDGASIAFDTSNQ
jgi:hypothetical protein